MGTVFSNVIVACLTCLEGGFGDGVDLAAGDFAPGVNFNERILEPLHGHIDVVLYSYIPTVL